ncbi:MAG: TerB family tellurite resistance protein [Salinibacter sp.]
MSVSNDEWTTAHDLALIYSGLACVDRDLTDSEVDAIEDPLQQWVPLSADTTVEEVVQEAATALKQSRKKVRRAVHRVGHELSAEECRETLQDLVRIAQADGVLLESERELIHSLATAWDLKQLRGAEADAGLTIEDRGENWDVLHELAFLFVQGGESTDEGLDSDLLGVMADRLREWQPERSDDDVRVLLRRALQAYADRDEEAFLRDSVEGIGEALSRVQQLIVLDDLYTLLHTGSPSDPTARRHLQSLARAWNINVRLDDA